MMMMWLWMWFALCEEEELIDDRRAHTADADARSGRLFVGDALLTHAALLSHTTTR
jgi:hypothetical protein